MKRLLSASLAMGGAERGLGAGGHVSGGWTKVGWWVGGIVNYRVWGQFGGATPPLPAQHGKPSQSVSEPRVGAGSKAVSRVGAEIDR